ncbi:universal stress protein [Cesiribacter sp. SM1]|uniref:universal stress protein n=1 Tax=Cesiribacter sp. SM1 TaxID=2861196 RepID=UPI001CD5E34F|nr:universal stress protein [Cesiribacter sp. SM1]
MKTILIATDYSKSANNALEYAAALAKGLKAKLVIYNAFNLALAPATAPDTFPDVDDLIRENGERINRIGTRISETYGIVEECVSTTDLVLDGLRKQVKKKQADLLVLGIKNRSMLTKVLGTLTTSVIRHSKVPVLVVPEDATFRGIRRLLFACDYKYLSENSRLEAIYEIAAAYKAQVQILHVEKGDGLMMPSTTKKQVHGHAPNMEELLRGIKHTYRFVHEESVLEGIKRGLEEYQADLLVMVPHKPGFWYSLIHTSITKEMALNTHVPLLALPALGKAKTKAHKVAGLAH